VFLPYAAVSWRIAVNGFARHLAEPSNAYSRLPSRSAQALATAEFGVSVPGIVAQPPFSMTDRRFHDETLLNSINFPDASAWCWNFSTQIGASTPTTAV
jgi:hypothetical protein